MHIMSVGHKKRGAPSVAADMSCATPRDTKPVSIPSPMDSGGQVANSGHSPSVAASRRSGRDSANRSPNDQGLVGSSDAIEDISAGMAGISFVPRAVALLRR
jgi:hypothetical protein